MFMPWFVLFVVFSVLAVGTAIRTVFVYFSNPLGFPFWLAETLVYTVVAVVCFFIPDIIQYLYPMGE